MQRSKEILNELEQLSMVVAGISRQMPYEAPEGYFSDFPGKLLALLEQDAPERTPSPDWGKGSAMSVPEGYFEGFASRMMDKIRAQGGQPVQAEVRPEAPEGEFSPLLSRIGKNMPYQVPEGYFDTSIPSAVLMGLKDKTVYEVPEAYFETLADIVIARIQPAEVKQAPGKLISIGSTHKIIWWKYAAAAVVAGFILTFGWLRLQTHSGTPRLAVVNVAQDLTKVSDSDIQNYVDDHTSQIQQVQQEEDYANSTASLDISDNDVKSLLGDVPDGDLAQYMVEHGDLKDYPTN
ncbi:MAG: hypothetical protein BGO55_19150 [Sphingobacteriales bacterium 50-39]|nr:hypothetical protein [Sphingobacteriales bacterium]OJW58839.1 MAG: hypothetical protein BGO55_19150 [Sphingobacteriales bacterium 50-39]